MLFAASASMRLIAVVFNCGFYARICFLAMLLMCLLTNELIVFCASLMSAHSRFYCLLIQCIDSVMSKMFRCQNSHETHKKFTAQTVVKED